MQQHAAITSRQLSMSWEGLLNINGTGTFHNKYLITYKFCYLT